MKKFCLLNVIACIFAGIVFISCDKSDDDPGVSSITSITAQVVKGSDYDLDNVKAVMYYGNDEKYMVAEGRYEIDKFTIILPSEVNGKYLENIGDDMPDGIKISDASASIGAISIEGYKSGDYVDDFYYAKIEIGITEKSLSLIGGGFIYVDKDVTITGSYSEKTDDGMTLNVSFNVFLKKGWNIMYALLSMSDKNPAITIKAVTKDPGGLKWYFAGGDLELIDLLPFQPKSLIESATNEQDIFPKYKIMGIKWCN